MGDLENLIGKKVNLTGIARDAKGGAVLVTTESHVIYIKALAFWSSELINKQLFVTGVLKREKIIPDPKIDANGGISSGATGVQLVLENMKVSKVR